MTENKSGKASFVCYETFYDSIKGLPTDLKARMCDLMFLYGLYKIIPEDITPIEMAILSPIMFGIDSAKKRRSIATDNGGKGGAPEGNQNAHKDRKCSACIHYRRCEDRGNAENCEDYVERYDKNKNNQNQAKTSENDLNVNVNVNEFKAFSLNAPRFPTSNDVDDNLQQQLDDVLEDLEEKFREEQKMKNIDYEGASKAFDNYQSA